VWCVKNLAVPEYERSYTLLLRIDDKNDPLSKCPDQLSNIDYIGGLQFIEVNEPAAWYYFIDSKKQVASDGALKTTAISSIYDGTGAHYICVEGKWAERPIH
jgi:hypothetical protein